METSITAWSCLSPASYSWMEAVCLFSSTAGRRARPIAAAIMASSGSDRCIGRGHRDRLRGRGRRIVTSVEERLPRVEFGVAATRKARKTRLPTIVRRSGQRYFVEQEQKSEAPSPMIGCQDDRRVAVGLRSEQQLERSGSAWIMARSADPTTTTVAGRSGCPPAERRKRPERGHCSRAATTPHDAVVTASALTGVTIATTIDVPAFRSPESAPPSGRRCRPAGRAWHAPNRPRRERRAPRARAGPLRRDDDGESHRRRWAKGHGRMLPLAPCSDLPT